MNRPVRMRDRVHRRSASQRAPDLAEMVAEERMSLNDATDAWIKRESYRRMIYQSGVSSVVLDLIKTLREAITAGLNTGSTECFA